jgi:heme/copper-type cytochrome/quinol oxidase subunit 2
MPIARVLHQTPPPRVTATASPTSTPTPSATPTPTSIATATPTRTATPAATVVIFLRGISWQWDFSGPGVNGGASIVLQVGQPYEIRIYNDAPPESSSHTFSGNADLGLSGAVLDPGAPAVVQRFTPGAAGVYPFLCTDSSCGTGHANMTGVIQVEPSLPLARDLAAPPARGSAKGPRPRA